MKGKNEEDDVREDEWETKLIAAVTIMMTEKDM